MISWTYTLQHGMVLIEAGHDISIMLCGYRSGHMIAQPPVTTTALDLIIKLQLSMACGCSQTRQWPLQPLTHTTCRRVWTISTRSAWFSMTSSMSL